MRRFTIVCSLIIAASSANRTFSSPFQNGNFETGNVPPNSSPSTGYWRELVSTPSFPIDNSIDGWPVTHGRVDWVGSLDIVGTFSHGEAVEDGDASIQLVDGTSHTSDGDSTWPSIISQTFDTAASESYTVSFYATADPGAADPTSIEMSFANNGITQSADFPLPVVSAFTYLKYSATFLTAPGTTFSTLAFQDDNANADTANGPYMDNVDVTIAVPAPGAATQAGLALAGCFFLRRRQWRVYCHDHPADANIRSVSKTE